MPFYYTQNGWSLYIILTPFHVDYIFQYNFDIFSRNLLWCHQCCYITSYFNNVYWNLCPRNTKTVSVEWNCFPPSLFNAFFYVTWTICNIKEMKEGLYNNKRFLEQATYTIFYRIIVCFHIWHVYGWYVWTCLRWCSCK